MATAKCAKCRDRKHWTKAEDVNGNGVLWHWFRCGDGLTALAKRCMKVKTRWDVWRWVKVETRRAKEIQP